MYGVDTIHALQATCIETPTGMTSVVIKACHETLHNTLTKMTQGKKTGSWRELGQSLYWNRGMITCDLGRTESSSIYMMYLPQKQVLAKNMQVSS